MKKICFIEPPYDTFIEKLDAPFSLLYLAAVAIEAGWQPQILDMNTMWDQIPRADVYAVTSSSPQWPDTIKLSERLATEYPGSLKLVGGSHISAIPSDLQQTSFDHAVVGEGELALKTILMGEGEADFLLRMHVIPGAPTLYIDRIPFPARHLIDWSRYKRFIEWDHGTEMRQAVSIISSRGCPHNCIFCGSHVIFGRHTQFRSVENVVAEIREVKNKLGISGFNFHDDTFCLNRRRVLRLCEAFEKEDIVWRCLTRADTIDEPMAEAMNRAGCKEIILGVESGSQLILDNLNKGVTVQQNLKAMQIIKNAGIQLKVGIIVGAPGETWNTVEETKNLLYECPPDFWNVSCFTPFPGSAVWANPEKHHIRILTRDLKQYAMVGKGFKGNVVVETEEMNKADIERARDELIYLCQDLAPTK